MNYSAQQFRLEGVVDTVARILQQTGLPASCLALELTESVIIKHTEQVIVRFEALDGMGVQLSIDDFGTGYSSLSYLKRFPIHELKIDQSFVRDISTDPDDAAIVSAIIAIAHSLGLEVVAEGVETAEQLAFLKSLGCDRAQGYYFSKPLPADEFFMLVLQSGSASAACALQWEDRRWENSYSKTCAENSVRSKPSKTCPFPSMMGNSWCFWGRRDAARRRRSE